MNRLIISGEVTWETDNKDMDKAIDELFDALVKSGLALDIDITHDVCLVDEYGNEMDEDE